MSATLQITSVTGSPKIAAPSSIGRRDSVADVLSNPAASVPTTPYTLTWGTNYLLALKKDSDFTLSFSADSSSANGQGFYIPENYYAEVTSASGTVYFVSNKFLTLTDNQSSAYSNSGKVAASTGTIVSGGYLVCNNTGSMAIKCYAYPSGGGTCEVDLVVREIDITVNVLVVKVRIVIVRNM